MLATVKQYDRLIIMQLTDPVRLEMRKMIYEVYGVNLDNSYNRRVTQSIDKSQIQVSAYASVNLPASNVATVESSFSSHWDVFVKDVINVTFFVSSSLKMNICVH